MVGKTDLKEVKRYKLRMVQGKGEWFVYHVLLAAAMCMYEY
jgi:hypothetical protein